jgi:hypothetical protein
MTKRRAGRVNPFVILALGGLALACSLLVGFLIYKIVTSQHGFETQGQVYQVDLKQLGEFQFDDLTGTINDIPPRFRDLDGRQIALEGFIFPLTAESNKIRDFQFVYNVQSHSPPRVQQRVFCHVVDGTIDAFTDEVRITGTFHIPLNKDKDTGKIVTVYTMDVNRVEQL